MLYPIWSRKCHHEARDRSVEHRGRLSRLLVCPKPDGTVFDFDDEGRAKKVLVQTVLDVRKKHGQINNLVFMKGKYQNEENILNIWGCNNIIFCRL